MGRIGLCVDEMSAVEGAMMFLCGFMAGAAIGTWAVLRIIRLLRNA